MLSVIRMFWLASLWRSVPTRAQPADRQSLWPTAPETLAKDIGVVDQGPLINRREMFWQESKRLGHRGLPY